MIIRARSKSYQPYTDYTLVEKDEQIRKKNDHLYFISGRATLKFTLQCFSQFYEVKANILMQPFNCSVVADAATEAKTGIILCDIDLNFFSISFSTLQKIYKMSKYSKLPSENQSTANHDIRR